MTDQQRPENEVEIVEQETSLDSMLEDPYDNSDTDTWDDSTAAEQGNRDEDEMVSEGDDVREVWELTGDNENVDAVAVDRNTDEYRTRLGVDQDGRAAGPNGDVDGGDPLAGGR